MAVIGKHLGLTLAELQTLRTELLATYSKCLKGHQGYQNGAGQSFQRVDLRTISDELAEVNHAIGLLDGSLSDMTVADLSA